MTIKASITPILGVNLERATSTPEFSTGTVVLMDDGLMAVYVQTGDALVPTDKVALTGFAAAKDNSTGTHLVYATAAADDYLFVTKAV